MLNQKNAPRTGGEILVDQLLLNEIDTVFAVPGESYLAALDALYKARNQARLITCRQEGGAAFMAEAYGKATGRPGVCFVTRGPGACNASIAVHTAMQDSTPMLLIVGQVSREMLGREAFQEIDFSQMFAPPITKMATQIDDAVRIPEIIHNALATAMSGRPGPVVVAVPEDMLVDECTVEDGRPARAIRPHAPPRQLIELREILTKTTRPVMILGGGGWTSEACANIAKFAANNCLPTAVSFRRQDLFDNQNDTYIGDLSSGVDPALVERVKDADCLLVVGARLGEMTTKGYTTIVPPRPTQRLLHVYADPNELGRVFQPDLAILSGMPSFAQQACELKPVDGEIWSEWGEAARKDYLRTQEPNDLGGVLDLAFVVKHVQETLAENTIVTIDAGNFSGWAHRFWRFREPRTELAPTVGAMGYSVPAGVAAQIAHPDRPVVSFVGDGGFMMTGQELATALQHGATPIILLFNNSMYGTIRMHQEREYPDRVIGTDLSNPDFTALARAYGAHGECVKRTEEFAPALKRAQASGKAAVIELILDPEQITTRAKLSEIREAARIRT